MVSYKGNVLRVGRCDLTFDLEQDNEDSYNLVDAGNGVPPVPSSWDRGVGGGSINHSLFRPRTPVSLATTRTFFLKIRSWSFWCRRTVGYP